MKRFNLLLAFLFTMGMFTVHAQTSISGTVLDDNGEAVPGANVRAKGYSDVGTISDLNGAYTLSVPTEATTLVFSFVGMKTQEIEIGGQTTINVTLQNEDVGLEEVVVTALGITRSEKSIGYASTTVSSDDITKSRSSSAMASLTGKIAGVKIQTGSGAPGSSTKVLLRGYSSLTGSNQPLYIVDGVPINNSTNNFSTGSNDLTRQSDFGNRANDINPEDIASVTVLKGASATALYGSRAANGVIMITTKGASQKSEKLRINFSSSAAISNPLRLPERQSVFGQGWDGVYASNENGSWGPKMDDKERVWGWVLTTPEGIPTQQIKKFSYQENQLKDFYHWGTEFNNSINVSGGTDKTSYYASFANVNNNGIVPGDGDIYKRNTFSFSGSTRTDKFTSSVSINYINRTSAVVFGGQGEGSAGPTLFQDMLQVPADISIIDMQYNYLDPTSFNHIDNRYTPYTDNPYFIINENGNKGMENRVYGSVNLEYDIIDNLTIKWRIGTDVANSQFSDWAAIALTSPTGYNPGRTDVPGSVIERKRYVQEINSDLILTYKTKFAEDFSLNAFVGHNVYSRYAENGYARVETLDIPGYYNLANSSGTPTVTNVYAQRRLWGLYAQTDLGFKEYAYLTLSARNDWSSTLPEENNTFFYPGVSFTFVLSDAVPAVQNILSFGKLRASWGQTGNDAAAYLLESVMIGAQVTPRFGNLFFPLGGVNAFEVGNRLGNKDLQPEITTEYEFGADLRFLENRIGIDVAYYDRFTDRQILAVPSDPSSGFTTQTRNIGKISNKGIELALTLVPVKTRDFSWDITATYTKNTSLVEELVEGLEEVNVGGFIGLSIYAIPGEPLGVMKGTGMAKDPDGNTIVDADGIPIAGTEDEVFGTIQPDFQAGLQTRLSYKGIFLSASMDYSKGGIMHSGSSNYLNWSGNTVMGAYNMREPWLYPNSVVEIDDGDGNLTYVENTQAMQRSDMMSDYWGTYNEFDLYDKTYFKLREVTLGYSLPKKLVEAVKLQNVEISVYGRNLFLWTPDSNRIMDPEMSSFGNDLESEFGEYATSPSVRTIGASLRIQF